jgi:hypothetical protein
MADKFVLALGKDGHSIVLGLFERTKADADQLISWMNQGGFGMSFAIATYDDRSEDFVAEDGTHHQPERGPYTAAAWQHFQTWIPNLAATRGRKLKGRA